MPRRAVGGNYEAGGVTAVTLHNGRKQSKTDSAALQIGVVVAVYLLWLVSWLVLGQEVFGPAHYNWAQTLVATVAALIAFNASRLADRPYPIFLITIGIGLAMLAASWVTYSPGGSHPFLRFSRQGAPNYSDIAYALFVFVWICAWGYLALKQWQRRPPSPLTGVVFAVLIVGLALILANFYYPQYRSSLDTMSGRLDAATSGLEFAALVIGLACILLGEPTVLTWMLFATALLVASDMAYSEADVPVAIEPVWMLGQFLLVSTLLVFPGAMEAVPPAKPNAYERRLQGCSAAVRLVGRSRPSFARGCAAVGGHWTGPGASGLEVIFVCPVRGGTSGRPGVAHRSLR